MGRRSKLTDFQAAEIQRRMAAGEPTRALAREFGVGEATLRRNFSAHTAKIQTVANKLASAEVEMAELPISAQMSVRSLADHLKAITSNVARAARAGSDTAAQLAELARTRAGQVMLQEPKDGHLVDRGVMDDITDLSIAANRALGPAMRLVCIGQEKIGADDSSPLAEVPDYSLLTLEQLNHLPAEY